MLIWRIFGVPKALLTISGAVLGVACISIPSPAAGQAASFFVRHDPGLVGKEGYYGKTTVWVAKDCKPEGSWDATTLKANCTLERTSTNTCQICPSSNPKDCDPKKYCKFLINATSRAPISLNLGVSYYNPTCVYMTYWDPWLQQQITIYGPC